MQTPTPPSNPEDATEFAAIRDAYYALRSEKANAKASGQARKAISDLQAKHPGKDGKVVHPRGPESESY